MKKTTIFITIGVTLVIAIVAVFTIIKIMSATNPTDEVVPNTQQSEELQEIDTSVEDSQKNTDVTEEVKYTDAQKLTFGDKPVLSFDDLQHKLDSYDSYEKTSSVYDPRTECDLDMYTAKKDDKSYEIYVYHFLSGVIVDEIESVQLDTEVDTSGYEDWDSAPVGR